MRPALPSERLALSFSAHLDSILKKEAVRREERKKPSCLANPLLTRNHQKSIFNSAVCVRFALNPQLYNPFHQPSLSCVNKHTTDPKRRQE